MKRIDQDESERYWKVLVYGDSGSGKTSLGVTAQKLGPTLVLLSERQGINPIRAAAKRIGVPVPAVIHVTDMVDYRAIVNALHGDKSKPFRAVDGKGNVLVELPEFPITVVIDSAGDAINNMMVASIRRLSPQKSDDDGLPVDADRFHNVITDKAYNFFTEFRDCPVNVLFLAHLDDKEVGRGKEAKRRCGPKFPNKNIPPIVASVSNLVGVSYRTVRAGETVFQVGFQYPSHVMSKSCEPLRAVEVADFAEWVTRLNDHTAPATPASDAVPDDLEPAVATPPGALAPAPGTEELKAELDKSKRASARREVASV